MNFTENEMIWTRAAKSYQISKEKIEIKSLKRGECLMFVGNEHILTKIESADFEKEIIV